jgi:hypothetical protein
MLPANVVEYDGKRPADGVDVEDAAFDGDWQMGSEFSAVAVWVPLVAL